VAHLQSIRLRGFKTFARPTELVFEPGVTVIIGPNGSGKSNIADAVLWVLGEQSPGNLRGRSMQDVLFSGPDGRRSSAVAEVSLIFDNESGSFPLETSQVEITRRLIRDGGSEYQINGAGCRLLDVQDLVGGLGLGREMHSVISQGKVEALLSSTPEVRRALVEEAAGLGRFKKRRERAQAKLERTRQNLLRVSDVEREVKTALRPLRQQVAAAERFAEVTEEWALAKAKWVLLALGGIEGSFRQTADELARLKGRRAQIEAGLTDLGRRRVWSEEQFTGALRRREALDAVYHRAQAEAERMEGRAVSLRQRIARMEGDGDRARRRRELARSELAALVSRLEELTAVSADETRLQVVGGWGQALRAALDESLPAYRAAAATEEDLKDTVFELEAARSRAVQDREFLRREVEERGRVGAELAGLTRTAAARLQQLREEAALLEQRSAAGEEVLREAQRALVAAVSDREETRARAAETSREEVALGEMLAGVEARQRVLQDLLDRREGIPSGAQELLASVKGCRLLTEVLTVEPGYERAFAAALGPLVQAVVLSEGGEIGLALQVEGPVEAIWSSSPRSLRAGRTAATSPVLQAPATLPPGTLDLWEVVSGPEAVIDTLKTLVPPTVVLSENERLADSLDAERSGYWNTVSRSGELVRGSVHAARRREAGAEALLRARNEIQTAAEARAELVEGQQAARKAVEEAGAAAARADDLCRQREASLREAESRLAAHKNECDLHARRIEEAEKQCAELDGRHKREIGLTGQMTAELRAIEQAMGEREAELEGARVSLRAAQAGLETLRRTVGRIEEKRSQAALLEVKLRERCRAHENERARTRTLFEAARAEAARCERRVVNVERYLPVLTELHGVVEQLAERSRALVTVLDSRVERTRAVSEEAAEVMRDWGGEEAELRREHEGLVASMTELQVDSARLDDRRSLLEGELAELRRRHLSPRALTLSDVTGEDAEALLSAVERSEKRRDRIGPVNPLAEQECAEIEERARFLAEQRRDLEASLAQLSDVISELDEHIERAFTEIFEATREHFSSVIATVFPGAQGALKLTEGRTAAQRVGSEGAGPLDDAADEEETREDVRGIALQVRLPNKAPRSMSLLSGGEKAMTAIAFLFSLFLARPCPFYILDEVEASLDDVNIRRFLALIRKYREKTQFIVITHQRQTMEVADTLYGVALESDGTSRVLSRRLGERKEIGNRTGRPGQPARPGRPEAMDLLSKGA
jgi:chromosome segregation protein